MIYLSDSDEAQTWTVIPRIEPTENVAVTITSEDQNKQLYSFSYAATYSNGYLEIVHTFDPVLTLNNSYIIEVKNASELIFRGKIYCTDQTDLPAFSINDGQFTEITQSNNEFTIINE